MSKRQHCFILHRGDDRQRVWHRHGDKCGVTTGATWSLWKGWWDLGWHFSYGKTELVQINGTSNATKYHAEILARHLMPSWDALCYRRALHFILLDSNCTPHTAWLVTARLVRSVSGSLGSLVSSLDYGIHDSIKVTRIIPCPTKAPDFKSNECLKSSEAPIEIEYHSQ